MKSRIKRRIERVRRPLVVIIEEYFLARVVRVRGLDELIVFDCHRDCGKIRFGCNRNRDPI